MATTLSFSAAVAEWALKVEGAVDAIFKASIQELVDQADELLKQLVYDQPPAKSGYKRTGFLRSSIKVSTTAMPLADRPQGSPDNSSMAEIEVQIAGAELGETIYVGWTAHYAPFVHYGSNAPPKPWVSLVAQRWQQIVDAKAGELKSRLGL